MQFADGTDFTVETNSSTRLGLVLECLLPPSSNLTKSLNVTFDADYATLCLEPVACDFCALGSDCAQAQADFTEQMVNVKLQLKVCTGL